MVKKKHKKNNSHEPIKKVKRRISSISKKSVLVRNSEEGIDNEEEIKKRLIKAYEDCFGLVTPACKQVGVTRHLFYKFYDQDPKFQKALEETEAEEKGLDLGEEQLHEKMKKGNITAIIFYLKCKGKKRGYIETYEVFPKDFLRQTIKICGQEIIF